MYDYLPSSQAGLNRPSALEADLPIEEISALAELESWRKEVNRPVYHIHKWWATRLGSVFRAILLAGNLDAHADVWQEFYKRQNFRDCVIKYFQALGLDYRSVKGDNATWYEKSPESQILYMPS